LSSKPPQSQETKTPIFALLQDDGTVASVLHVIALGAYGPEIYEVDPTEVVLRLEEDYNAKLTQENEDKLKAIMMATATDAFYEDTEAFRGLCETLSNGDPGVEMMDSLTGPEVLWGLYEVELNHGPAEVTPKVQATIDYVLASEGLDPEDPSYSEDAHSHYWAYMRETHERLAHQLKELGIHPQDIPPVDDPTAIHDPAELVMP
jgi:hypothetical protein